MKYLRIIILLTLLPLADVSAQTRVKLISDPKLDSLVSKNIEINKSQQTIDGYRIQLFSGSERNNANALRTRFKTDYPDENVYLIYQQPYFKLRVGDYRNLIEAQEMYLQLQKTYDQLLIVPDKINLPKL
ncbi:MAG: SPOR domain-containing protein [Bacteroidia bacterium]|nr:SPOR domain-containing protein [Bacteroidia bacterium]